MIKGLEVVRCKYLDGLNSICHFSAVKPMLEAKSECKGDNPQEY